MCGVMATDSREDGQIITKDEEVVKYVLTTGHDHFGHGSRVKEILSVYAMRSVGSSG